MFSVLQTDQDDVSNNRTVPPTRQRDSSLEREKRGRETSEKGPVSQDLYTADCRIREQTTPEIIVLLIIISCCPALLDELLEPPS